MKEKKELYNASETHISLENLQRFKTKNDERYASKSHGHTPSEIGAVNKAGDTMNGTLTVPNLKVLSSGQITNGSDNVMVRPGGSSGNDIVVGNQSGVVHIDSSSNPLVRLGSNTYPIYHTGNKPNKADIGLSEVQNYPITNSVTDASGTKYASANAVKQAYDLANGAHQQKVAKAGDTMTGGLTFSGAPTAYDLTQFGNGVAGTKNYLRKMRGGATDTIWHETVQRSAYKLSTGSTDSQDEFTVENGSGWLRANRIYTTGYKPTPADIGAAVSNHGHSNATTAASGFMSNTDKAKLDGIATGANNYVHPNDANTRHVTDAEKNNWNGKANSGSLGSSTNLDTINTNGIYTNHMDASATSENKYPIKQAGALFAGVGAYSSACQIYGSYSSNRWFVRGGGNNATSKTAWQELYHTGFKPTPADIGAATSNHTHTAQTTVSGNAGTATKLQTARSINGTNFDGSANITTANWGTARNLQIGNTAKSVNGSGNVSWSLAEIGAAASNHTHSYVPLTAGPSITIHADSDSSSASEFIELKAGHNALRVTSSAGGGTVTQANNKITYNGHAVYHAGQKPTKADVGLPNVQDVSLNWAWGSATPTHIWGSQGDSKQSYVYNGGQLKTFIGLSAVNNWGASSDVGANSTTQYATTNMVAKVRGEKANVTGTLTHKGNANLDTLVGTAIAGFNNGEAGRPADWGGVLQWANINNPTPGTNSHWLSQLAFSTNDRLYHRTRTNTGGWTGWGAIYSTKHKPSAADIGAAASNHGHTSLTAGANGATQQTIFRSAGSGSWGASKNGAVEITTTASGSTAHPFLRHVVDGSQKGVFECLNSGATWRLTVNGGTYDFGGGNLTSSGNIIAYSDIKLKKDLEIIPNAIEKITSLNGYTYTRKDSGDRQTGVVAQEVEKILPEAIVKTKEADGEETLGVAYGNMVGLLIEGIKELKKEVDFLKEKLSKQEFLQKELV